MVDKGLIIGESKMWANIVVRVANALGFASSNLSPSWLLVLLIPNCTANIYILHICIISVIMQDC